MGGKIDIGLIVYVYNVEIGNHFNTLEFEINTRNLD